MDKTNFWVTLISILFGTTGVVTLVGNFLAKRWQSKFDDGVVRRKELHEVQQETINQLRAELKEQRLAYEAEIRDLRAEIEERNEAYNNLYRDYVKALSGAITDTAKGVADYVRDSEQKLTDIHKRPEQYQAESDFNEKRHDDKRPS